MIWALVPVKPFGLAKSRLAPALGAAQRAAFARSMLEHVLEVLGASPDVAGVMVVTRCPEASEVARARGAIVSAEAMGASLAAVVDAGLRDLRGRGAGGALVVMSDLPRLGVDDVAEVARRMREVAVVAAPDFRGEGTNALGISPPDRMSTSFGSRESFAMHGEGAKREGLSWGVVRREGLELDVDAPEDLLRATVNPWRP